MKYLSKLLSMLLVGAMLYSTGCTDYETDIENLENKVDQIQEELQKGQIDPLKADLAQTKEDLANAQAAIEALTAKHNEDIAALKAVDSQLDGKIAAANDSILALEAALQQEVAALEAEIAALETAIAQAKQEAKDADAALKAELLQEITDLETELLAKVNDLQSKLEGDIEDLRDNMQEKIDAANEAIEDANDAIDALDLRADALEQTDAALEAEIDALEAEIEATKAKIAVLESDLAAEKAARETADAEEKAAREAAVKALEESIAALETKLNTQVALLEDAIEALNTKVDTEVAALKQRDAELAEELAATQAGLAALASEVEAKYNELKGDIAALKAELKAEIDANKAAIAQNKADIDRAFVAIETLGDNLAALQASVEAVNNTLFALMSDYYSFKAQITGRVAALESSVANLETLYAEVAEELIPALEEQIAQNAALIEQNAADLKANAAELEAYKKAAAETYALLEQADAALWQAISSLNQTVYENRSDIAALRTELVESLAGVRAEVEAAFAAVYSQLEEMAKIQAAQYGVLVDSIEAVRELTANNAYAIAQEIEARQAADAAIVKDLNEFKAAYEVKMVELDDAIAALESRITALEEDLAAYKVAVAKAIEDAVAEAVETSNEYTDLQIELAVNTINAKIAEVEQTIADLDAAYKAADAILSAQIINGDQILQEQINDIVKRAQSLVFVPKYTDGKGTINFAKAGDTVVESRSQAEYQVYPAECAKAIVSAFKVEEPILTFDHEYLSTRGANPFKVVAVEEGSKEGRIVVTFETRGLDPEFYAGNNKEYALSLVLTTEKVNLSSAYTNFVRAEKANKIGMAIMFNGESVSNNYDIFEFEYTDLETVEDILKDHYVKFTVGGKTYAGIEELNAAGYAVALEGSVYTYREFNSHLGVKPFAVAENEEGVLQVKVNEVKREYIYQPLEVGYQYTLGTLYTKAYATVQTVPVKATITYDAIDINWLYANDVNVDAALLNGEVEVYSRNLSMVAETNDLPSDITIAQVIKSALKKDVVVTLNGEAVAVNAAFSVDAEDNVKLAFSGFEWDKTYEVTAVYGVMDKYGQESAVVTVKATINTIDRTRDLIEVNFDDAQWNLTKDFLYQSETDADDLNPVYEAAKSYLGEMTPEAFLKDIFVTNEFFASENLANEVEMEFTKFVIVTDGAEVKTVYNINEYAEIPEAIEYVYNITTFYGQEIVITKKLNIGLTPVEITLATETKDLVKDLTFTTSAESLVEIFNLVTRVEKDQFTAEEYLAAIFTNNVMRDQSDLANGETLADTKLVVYAPNAAAKYDYNNFSATPESVVYKSTYTTWYGQEITINKVVNINIDGLYNYVHVPQWVYNVDGSGFYSNAIPKYLPGDVAYLDDILVKLDMNTAFRVYNKEGQDVTDELESLGLTNKFMFVQEPTDARIDFKENNMLYYHGHDKKVFVKAQLTLENTNGVKTVLPSNFDEGEKYDGYYVNQYNPVGILKSEALNIPVANIAKTYSYNVINQLKLTDNRGFNLLKRGEIVAENDNEVVWSAGEWVIGDKTNGFGEGVSVQDVYGLKFVSLSCSKIPAHLEGKLEFNASTGELYFNNLNNIQLAEPVVLTIKVVVEHEWATQTTEFEVTLYNVK